MATLAILVKSALFYFAPLLHDACSWNNMGIFQAVGVFLLFPSNTSGMNMMHIKVEMFWHVFVD